MMMSLLIIIPAFNEAESISGVIGDLNANLSGADILVVDDGSVDATARIASDLGVNVLKLPFNLGIGGAMQAGFLYAQREGYDIAVQFDGDGQHLAREIKKLLQPVVAGNADIALGSRFLGQGDYKPSFSRKVGIRVFSTILSCILGTRVTDTTSGFRAANRRVIEFFSRTYPDDYPEVEALVLLHKAGMTIAEVPVQMRERTSGQSSITAVRSVYYMVKVLLAVCIDLLKKTR
jgi:glycosyltransferase involved in cell wall biosynthesis